MATAKARLVQDFKPVLLADIRRKGLWRCGVMLPNCQREPVAALEGTDGIHRLFCQKHMRQYCAEAGIPEPVYPSLTN